MTEPSLPEESLFTQALEISSAAERAAFLDRACGDNQALRAEVEALLHAHEQSGDLLDLPDKPPGTTDLPGHERPGTLLGPYKLLESIGEGGMGMVWMAEQTEPIRRRVAVKVVKEGMDSRQVLARFEAERQALALMDHPNIARVFDAGKTPSGRPYFVMELVKGQPITKYCDEKRLPVRQRLELFGDVCRAVQHAHQKGIIHRDLKPSNVLVAPYDGRPVVKVIDFGVAKATGQRLTDKTLFTGFGALVGTPEYMSPEQAEVNNQDIDTRSDIYSLGVILYELLTGSTPLTRQRLKETPLLEVLRVIREEEPPRPSTRLSESKDTLPSLSAQRQAEPGKLTKLVRGELDWIVMKALEKARIRRYETANGFAMDVQRYLADEPVLACPPSAWYRLRKFARRNKTALAVIGLILFFIALIGGGAGWVMRDRSAREEAAANDLERALDRAELLQGQGKRAEAVAALERVELLAGQAPSDPARDERMAALKERLAAEARDQEFITHFEKFRLEVRSQVNVRESQFDGPLDELRDAFTEYGITPGDMAPAQAAALIVGRPKPIRLQLIAALGEALSMMEHGQPLRQWLLAVLDLADNDPWRRRFWKAVQAKTEGNLQVVEQLARELDVRTQPPSFLLLAAGNVLTNKQVRLALFRRIQHGYPADLWANHYLAFELIDDHRDAEAVRYFTAALALRPANAGIYLNRGSALMEAGEIDASIADFRQAIALEPNYAMAHAMLGSTLVAKKQWDEALAECNEAIRLNPKLWLAWGERGRVHQHVNRLELSIADHSQAIKLNPKAARPFANRCNAYLMLQQYEKALADSTEAIRLDPKDHLAHGNHAFALNGLGRGAEAMESYRQAIRLKEDYPEAHSNLAILLVTDGRFAEALVHFRRAEELAAKIPDWPYPTTQMRRQCERQLELDGKLAGFLEGKSTPASPVERIELAELCTLKHLPRAAARFYGQAFSEQPALANDLGPGHRYNAACSAALAGCGQGKDTAKLDNKEREQLRRQALDWLRDNLESVGRLLDKTPDKAPDLTNVLKHWLADPDFAGVRGPEAFAKLPADERQAWQKLWKDISDMLKRAQKKAAPEKKSGAK
jgi:serine/threonine protein kinase/tetratricopeptide (TPR) repeat protein